MTAFLKNGETYSGSLTDPTDTDQIEVTLQANFAYQFDLQVQGVTNPGFLLLDPSGKLGGYISGGAGQQRITYTPTRSDTFDLKVYGQSAGSYTITSAPMDDYATSFAPTATLAVGGAVSGVLQTVADTDDFSVTLTAGVAYQFDLQIQGALTDPSFTLTVGGPSTEYAYSVGPGSQRITFIPNNSTAYRLSVSGSTTGSYTITSSSAPITSRAPEDFSNDNNSDLLLQNENGALVIWTQADLAITRTVALGDPGPDWHAVAVADINGDGQPDLLLQNDNGAIVDYAMIGTTIEGSNYLGNAGPSWHIRGAADFNHDSNADILLQNDDGTMVIWINQGGGITGGISLGDPGASWTIEGVADFNGDGQPDILIQNRDGTIVDYLMNRTAIASGANLGNPGPTWSIAGTGDYNGDGKADILLHDDDGTDVVWNTNGTTVTGTALIGNPGPSYTNAVAGLDLNGDGTSDLVIQNTDSTVIGYTLNGNTVTAGANLGVPGPGWHTLGNNPIEFIDGTHGNTNLVATPGPDQFVLTTFTGGLQKITGFDPAQDTLALSAATFPNYAGLQNNESLYQGGTFITLTPGTTGSAIVIPGVTPDQLSAANFVLR